MTAADAFLAYVEPYAEEIGKPTVAGQKIKLKKDVASNPRVFPQIWIRAQAAGARYSIAETSFILPPQQQPQNTRIERRFVLLTELVPGPNPRLDISQDRNPALFEYMRTCKPEDLPDIECKPSSKFAGKLEIVDGNCRYTDAVILQWTGLWAKIFFNMTLQQAYIRAYTVNHGHNGFTEYEDGHFFKQVMELFPEKYPTQQAVADDCRVSQPYVSQAISHYEFTLRTTKNVAANQEKGSIITAVIMSKPRTTREIRQAPAEVQADLTEHVAEKGVNSDETHAVVQQINADVQAGTSPSEAFKKAIEEPKQPPPEPSALDKLEDVKQPNVETALGSEQAAAAKEQQVEAEKTDALTKRLSVDYPAEMVEAVFEVAGRVGEVKARQLLRRVCEKTWRSAESEGVHYRFVEEALNQ